MRYLSTRGEAPELDFAEAILAGLARDGGLYLPKSWPRLDIATLAGLDYEETAFRVMRPFIGHAFTDTEFRGLIDRAYASFAHRARCPLVQIGSNEWVMELHHGPTLAFKDVAMQLIGQLFAALLTRAGRRATIVGATSGDTGSAAIEAFRGQPAVDVFILYPHERVSEVQRRQMTTPADANVHAIAIEGNFDDCQAMVKAMFNDHAFRDRLQLAAINSINWARVLAQVVYYVTAAVALGAPQRPVSFSVPTGNFGDVFAGYVARTMGVPIERLIIATNRNDILHRTLTSGRYQVSQLMPTIAPSMDIQVSSNFERVLFDACGRDHSRLRAMMAALGQQGGFELTAAELSWLRARFASARADEAETLAVMREIRATTGQVIDPHTAIGVFGARACRGDASVPMVTLGTAHAAKFPAAVQQATGVHPSLPPHMADLFERPERLNVLPNDLRMVQGFIQARVAA